MNTFSPHAYRRLILIIVSLSSFLVPFMGSSINLALPYIAKEFSMNVSTMGWLVTVYLLTTAIFQVPFGRLADMIGRKNIFVSGLCIFSLSSILCCIAHNATFFIIYRAIQGIGSALTFSTSMAILTDVFPPKERGQALGINAAVVYISAAAGPFLGGMLTHYLGWHSIFICVAVVAVIVAVLLYHSFKEHKTNLIKEPFDYIGSIIYGLTLFAFIFGFTSLPKSMGFFMLSIAIVGLFVFVFYEKKTKYPVFNINVFLSNKAFSLSSAAAFINYAATSGIGFLLSLYLQFVKGFEARHAGLVLIAQPLAQAILSPYAGKLSDRIQPRYLSSVGMALIAMMLFMLCFVTGSTHIYLVIIILLLLGIGFAFFSSPNINSIMSSVNKNYYSMASATTGTMRLTGQSFSMGLAMMVISLFLHNKQISIQLSMQYLQAMHVSFFIFAIFCLLGVWASFKSGMIRT